MSVYIKGMEMPTSCFYCPFRRKVDPENIMCIVTRELFEETFAGTIETRNRGNCPLVPVPEHGELIDRNETAKTLAHDYAYAAADMVRYEMPTIIPADKEGEG